MNIKLIQLTFQKVEYILVSQIIVTNLNFSINKILFWTSEETEPSRRSYKVTKARQFCI